MSERLASTDGEAVQRRVVEALRAGSLVVVPTDTVYAVVSDAFQPMATTRLRGAKRRGREVPLPVVLYTPRQVSGLVADVPEAAERLMASYWPGPLTIVFGAADGLSWDLGDTRGTVALRLPADDLLLKVAAEVGPLACTGANRVGEPPAVTIDEAELQLGLTAALYVDGGRRDGVPSTIVDVTRGRAEVLREGAIPTADIVAVAAGELPWGARPEPAREPPADAASEPSTDERPETFPDTASATPVAEPTSDVPIQPSPEEE